jgi:hypothetical protein
MHTWHTVLHRKNCWRRGIDVRSIIYVAERVRFTPVATYYVEILSIPYTHMVVSIPSFIISREVFNLSYQRYYT